MPAPRGLPSKTRGASADAARSGFSLVMVLPAFILGPVLGPDHSASLALVSQMQRGKVPAVARLGFSRVDVRDLVDLHLRAMTSPEAAGQRFVASARFLWMAELAQLLREHLGDRKGKPGRLAVSGRF